MSEFKKILSDNMGEYHLETVKCVRCHGKGSANPFTYPDQSHYKGCQLCKGTGVNEVKVYDTLKRA